VKLPTKKLQCRDIHTGKHPDRETDNDPWEALPGKTSHGQTPALEMAGRTRAIVRLGGAKRMVTKGYRKGVYDWVTKGINGRYGQIGQNWPLYTKRIAGWYKAGMWLEMRTV
jgi:hypothetical protein